MTSDGRENGAVAKRPSHKEAGHGQERLEEGRRLSGLKVETRSEQQEAVVAVDVKKKSPGVKRAEKRQQSVVQEEQDELNKSLVSCGLTGVTRSFEFLTT